MFKRFDSIEERMLYMKRAENNALADDIRPIFEILLFENPDKELISKTGDPTGFPDFGTEDRTGFYYKLDDAISAVHENRLDIRDGGSFNAGFILCKFPGLYGCADTLHRLYFLWDEEKQGFYETDEPPIFSNLAI